MSIEACMITNQSDSFIFTFVAGATPPTNLTANPVDPTSIKVSWTRPTSGAAVTGYRIYYRALGSVPYHGSVDVGANKTQHIVSNLRQGFVYIITMVTRSQYLPSTVTAPIRATLGKIYTRQVPLQYAYI